MGYSRLISSLFFILTYLVNLTVGQKEPLQHFCNHTANSAYSANLKSLLSSVSTISENDYGFYNMSAGQNTDKVNGIALCRGDVKPDDCISCITTAANKLTDLCPNQKEAIIWYDNCMFRYSNRTIFGKPEEDPRAFVWNMHNVTNWDGFNQALKTLLDSLRSRAAAGDSRRKFATGNGATPDSQHIFALVQCTPDLSETDCNRCLAGQFNDIPLCCEERQGGRVIAPSCNFRYEINRFYDPAADPQPASPPSPSAASVSPPPPSNETKTVKGEGSAASTRGGSNTSTSVTIIVACVVVFITLII